MHEQLVPEHTVGPQAVMTTEAKSSNTHSTFFMGQLLSVRASGMLRFTEDVRRERARRCVARVSSFEDTWRDGLVVAPAQRQAVVRWAARAALSEKSA